MQYLTYFEVLEADDKRLDTIKSAAADVFIAVRHRCLVEGKSTAEVFTPIDMSAKSETVVILYHQFVFEK